VIADIPAVSPPAAKSPGAKTLLDTLAAAGRQGRDQIATAATSAIAATQAAVDRHAAEVQVAETASADEVQAHFQTAHQQLSATIEQHADSISQKHDSEQNSIANWHAQVRGRVEEDVQHRSNAVASAGAAQGARIIGSGERAAEAAHSGLSAAASQAQAQSGGGGGEGHGEVAKRLGGDAAGQFEAASGEVGTRLQSHAAEAAAELDVHTGQAAAAVAGHAATLGGQVDQTAEGAVADLGSHAQQSIGALHAGKQQAHAELQTAEAKVVDAIRGRAGEHRDHIHAAGSQAIAGLSTHAQDAAGAAQRQLAQHAEQLAGLQVDEKAAAEVAPTLHAQVVDAHALAVSDARQTESKLTSALSAGGRDAVTSLARAAPAAAVRLTGAVQTVTADAHRIGAAAGAALTHAADSVKAGAEAGISKSVAQLDQVVETARTGLGSAGQAAEQSVGQGAGEAKRLQDEAMTGLHGRIAEGEQRVDSFVAAKGPTVQRSVLGAIGGWFADQFKDLWDMLSSPAFWVGLVVTIVLFPALGPGAFVVGGLAAGAVSGIQQNISQGRSWYDYRNILRNAAVGALGGALMALGIGAIVYFGLEGAAATLAVMGLSAVVGIVTNLINGDRWDRGLLANLLLAWLFKRFGGRFLPERPGVPPEEEPVPGRTTTRVPGLRESIDPNAKVPGFSFKDTVSSSGREIQVTTDVTASDGSTGTVIRGVDPSTGRVGMHYADLENIPKPLRWVPTDPEMVQGKGTPLETYMTMRQLRILEDQIGKSLEITAPRVVEMTTILNEKTIAQLAKAAPGVEPPSRVLNQAILSTDSVTYAKNTITQSGGRIAGARVEGGRMVPASEAGFRGISPEVMAANQLSPNSMVLNGFDIILDVVPADTPVTPQQPQMPRVPVPVPLPHDDHDGGTR
jgi:hypothetical protein